MLITVIPLPVDANTYTTAETTKLYSFGQNEEGQLGHGDKRGRELPTKIQSISNAKAVSAGGLHSLIITEEGDVYSFGWNQYGQLGLGHQNDRLQPTKIPALKGDKFISVGNAHTVATVTEDFGGDSNQLKIEVEQASATLVVGNSIKLKTKSNKSEVTFTYTSTDPSIAMVTSDGTITAKKPGGAIIETKATHQDQERIETTYITVKNEGVISVGDFIEFGRHYNEPILWRVINIDDKGDLLLFSQYLLSY